MRLRTWTYACCDGNRAELLLNRGADVHDLRSMCATGLVSNSEAWERGVPTGRQAAAAADVACALGRCRVSHVFHTWWVGPDRVRIRGLHRKTMDHRRKLYWDVWTGESQYGHVIVQDGYVIIINWSRDSRVTWSRPVYQYFRVGTVSDWGTSKRCQPHIFNMTQLSLVCIGKALAFAKSQKKGESAYFSI